MTDIWDEKTNMLENVGGVLIPSQGFLIWLGKMKAEFNCMSTVLSLVQSLGIIEKGKEDTEYDWVITSKVNELKEKSEKWDELPLSIRVLFDASTPEEFIQHYKDVDKAVDKLEAIKKYTETEFKAGYLIKPIDILKILEE